MKKFFVLIILLVSVLFAQENIDKQSDVNDNIQLTGNLRLDAKLVQGNTPDSIKVWQTYNEQKKSPLLAALMSLAVPGTGDIYNKSGIWKTAIYFGVEAAAITVGLIYDGKGDDQTDFYQAYADENWSVNRYAEWTVNNAERISQGTVTNASEYGVFNTDGSVNWSNLNKLENDIPYFYSHQLAKYGDQQYYEMIGKYTQFNSGWDDFPENDTEYSYGDPVTAHFSYYSGERGKANDYYDVAKWAVIGIVTNHVISALESAWSTKKYNDRLKMQIEMQKEQVGFRTEFYPQLSIQARF